MLSKFHDDVAAILAELEKQAAAAEALSARVRALRKTEKALQKDKEIPGTYDVRDALFFVGYAAEQMRTAHKALTLVAATLPKAAE